MQIAATHSGCRETCEAEMAAWKLHFEHEIFGTPDSAVVSPAPTAPVHESQDGEGDLSTQMMRDAVEERTTVRTTTRDDGGEQRSGPTTMENKTRRGVRHPWLRKPALPSPRDAKDQRSVKHLRCLTVALVSQRKAPAPCGIRMAKSRYRSRRRRIACSFGRGDRVDKLARWCGDKANAWSRALCMIEDYESSAVS